MALGWSSTMRKKFDTGRKGGSIHQAERGAQEQQRGRSNMAPVHREGAGDPEAHARQILIIRGARSCIVLFCFNRPEDESFERKSDTTKCVFQEDSSGGAAVPQGEMRNTGRKRLLQKQLVQVSDGRVGPRILRK